MGIYTATIDKMEAQLNVWGEEIKLLEAKIENAGSGIKLQRSRELNELRSKQRAAAEKLKEMKNATDDVWEQIKETADKIWHDLKADITNAHSNFK
jgi:archaellum component FlaC